MLKQFNHRENYDIVDECHHFRDDYSPLVSMNDKSCGILIRHSTHCRHQECPF